MQLILLLLAFTLALYLPIFANPSMVLSRSNDLEEFFWPIFYFTKQQLVETGTLPLWNNLFLSGTPLLPDPQTPLFYIPNIIFLFLPLGAAFIASFFLHSLAGGLGAYLAARLGFGFSKSTSLFTGLLYITTPRLAGYLEAGHFGLISSAAWIPFAVLGTVKLAKTPEVKWSLLLAVSLAGLFYTHLLIFAIGTVAAAFFWAVIFFLQRERPGWKRGVGRLLLASIILFGLIAVALLPQLEWQQHTTRVWLAQDHDIFPKWSSAGEFLQSVFWPWGKVWQLDAEKWLALGTIPLLLALLGFGRIEKKARFLLIVVAALTSALALNNASPLYPFFATQDWYALLRVSTRVWFIPTIIIVFLAGFGFEHLVRKKAKTVVVSITLLAVAELFALFWLRLAKPAGEQPQLAPQGVYEFLASDEGRFRVFCTTRCLSQKEAAEKSLELVDGYSTLQQVNYFKHSWQLMGGYWNYYTLAVPPIGAYKFEELQPDALSLGEFNTKYVVSPYELTDENFILEKQFDDYGVYKNSLFLPRAYFQTDEQKPGEEAPILKFTPNHILVDTSSQYTGRLVLSEVWSPGWNAYLNGNEKVNVQERPNTLRLVNIKPNTEFVDFRYQPASYRAGRLITLFTVLVLLGVGALKWKKQLGS